LIAVNDAKANVKVFRPAARTADLGEAAVGVTAVEILLDDLLDDCPEMAVGALESALVLGDKPLEMMEEHPLEGRAFRISGTVDSRHCERMTSRNGPTSWR